MTAADAAAIARRRTTRLVPCESRPGASKPVRHPTILKVSSAAGMTRPPPGRRLEHVAALDVGELVGDHHPHLVAREVAEQGVVEHDVPAPAEPGHVRVGRGGPGAGVVHHHVVGLDTGPIGGSSTWALRSRSRSGSVFWKTGSSKAATAP